MTMTILTHINITALNHHENDVLEAKPKLTVARQNVHFKNLVSKVNDDNRISDFLFNTGRASQVCIRSNKSIRKLENMLDVLHFTSVDFTLIAERFHDASWCGLIQDMIAILKSAKNTITQESIKSITTMKLSEDIFVISVYAAMGMIMQIRSTQNLDASLCEEFKNIHASLLVALEEHLKNK
jgi:hypothetical protein